MGSWFRVAEQEGRWGKIRPGKKATSRHRTRRLETCDRSGKSGLELQGGVNQEGPGIILLDTKAVARKIQGHVIDRVALQGSVRAGKVNGIIQRDFLGVRGVSPGAGV